MRGALVMCRTHPNRAGACPAFHARSVIRCKVNGTGSPDLNWRLSSGNLGIRRPRQKCESDPRHPASLGKYSRQETPMSSNDPTHCRERLAALLAGQNAQLAALEDLLKHEYALLEAQDVEGLEQAAAARKQCVDHILRFDDDRRALGRAQGCGDDSAGLHSLLAWCDPSGLLWTAMQEYRERTQRCREQNDRNGFLVIGRMQRTSGKLDVLNGGKPEGNTYGPDSGKNRGYGSKLTTSA
jgi:flagellar biosynthesis/type III secretory pathway chaperone